MIGLYLEAPFAVFRTFTAGWYRPTATFLTPSAAYGLVLNLAGIESRLVEGGSKHDGKAPATYIRNDLPSCRIAIGVPKTEASVAESEPTDDDPENAFFPRLQSVFQQLHNYPVGSTGKERKADAYGNKYNIAPVRREFLSDLRAIVLLEQNDDLERQLRSRLTSDVTEPYYGLPFLGDNSFLLDRCDLLDWPTSRFDAIAWYEVLGADVKRPVLRASRLTTWIDRADSSQTRSELFAPSPFMPVTEGVPNAAWVEITSPR